MYTVQYSIQKFTIMNLVCVYCTALIYSTNIYNRQLYNPFLFLYFVQMQNTIPIIFFWSPTTFL